MASPTGSFRTRPGDLIEVGSASDHMNAQDSANIKMMIDLDEMVERRVLQILNKILSKATYGPGYSNDYQYIMQRPNEEGGDTLKNIHMNTINNLESVLGASHAIDERINKAFSEFTYQLNSTYTYQTGTSTGQHHVNPTIYPQKLNTYT